MACEIVIADDQELMRMSFRMVFGSQPDLRVTGEAADGEEAVRVALAKRPHVVLMDVQMPGMDGLTATARLLDADPRARVILITTFDTGDCAQRGHQVGALGLLLKDSPPAELISAVRAVARGEKHFPVGVGGLAC